MITGIYPGSFDPVTLGHLDIIKRSAKMVDHLIIGVLNNSAKRPLFSAQERVDMLKLVSGGLANVSVETFDGLTVEFARSRNATVMFRGLRAVTDFEYEIQIAQTNHALMPEIDTVFLTTSIKYSYLSSSIVKEVASYGGDIIKFVPAEILPAVLEKFRTIRSV
ncbi:MAG: pantetheine-phosphate adenylyltransferase [Lachnospiraceae bacterium]|nr:pantetheine-phosphate adenylyltransferase [Lachnospiraceae bacterium]